MAFRKFKELLFGVFILAVMAFYFIFTLQLKQTPGKVDASTLPYFLCAIMFILGVLQVRQGIRAIRLFNADNSPKETQGSDGSTKVLLATITLIVLYVAMFRILGFIIATFLYLFAQFCVLTPGEQKPKYILYAVIAAVAALLIYLGFRYGLNLMLPHGLIKGV